MTGADITLTFLGTGSAVPPLNRQQACMALRHGFGLIIFDCGEGAQYALRKNQISTTKELIVCITHLHSDHFLGLPGLLASFELLNREDGITILGPKHVAQLVQNLMIANFVKTTYQISVVELEPGELFSGHGFTIQAIKAIHEANALSYIFRENSRPGKMNIDKIKEFGIPDGPLIGELQRGNEIEVAGKKILPDMVMGPERSGRSICYTGDTAPNQILIERLKVGCDVLVHEATYPSDAIELASERNHSTVKQAIEVAKAGEVGHLILTHISPRIMNFKEEIKENQDDSLTFQFAKDGLKFVLPFK